MIRIITLALLAGLMCACSSQKEETPVPQDYPIAVVPIGQVKLSDSFWLPIIQTVQNTTIRFALDKCEKEGRMDNFLIAGGKKEGTTRGKMPFDDTDLYKIIEGASNSLISAPDPKLEAYLDTLISIIAIGQEPDGYLTTWHTIDPTRPPAEWVKPGKRWESEISSHELYNAGHLYEAAAVHYEATGKRNLLDIALKNANLLVDTFGPGKRTVPPGHQIVETGLIKLFRITGDTRYMNLARFFLDVRGDSTSHPLYGAYSQDHLKVTDQNEAVGHAVRAVYMYAGMTDVAALQQDSAYLEAVKKLWQNVVDKKMYITGGIGARHDGEAFGDNYELPNLTAYNETCASIGDVYWNHRLFLLTGESRYFDVIERTLYNGLISGISLDGKSFFYPNPLESDGVYTFNQGAKTRSEWFDCSCCPTNLIRFLPSVPGLLYATRQDTLYVNLFASNTAHIQLAGGDVQVDQTTQYPWDGEVVIKVTTPNPVRFTMKVRIPGWTRGEVTPGSLYSYLDASQETSRVYINGKPATEPAQQGYVSITREWVAGDVVTLTLPMKVRRVVTNQIVTDNQGKVALEYGPLVYCLEGVDNPGINSVSIADNESLTVEFDSARLNGVTTIRGSSTPWVAIPYYAWANRGVTPMKVWLPRGK